MPSPKTRSATKDDNRYATPGATYHKADFLFLITIQSSAKEIPGMLGYEY
jgi:hypothetical protein